MSVGAAGGGGNSLAPLMERMFNDFDTFGLLRSPTMPSAYIIPMDMKETKTSYELACDLPGLQKENIHIDFKDNKLTVSTERCAMIKEKDESFRRIERTWGHAERTIQLNAAVDESKIRATYENGVLNLTLPKLNSSTEAVKVINIE